ncbi:MAG: type 2 isopentenyl-diphosphate Delta-isomerase [Nitrososphaeria archaeon]
MSDKVQRRKVDHISICLKENVESPTSAGFEHLHLVHNSLPEIDFEEVNPSTSIFGHKLSFPFLFDSITGGPKETKAINQAISEVAQEKSLGLFLGSVRSALEDPSTKDTYIVARDVAPDIFLAVNIGAPQLSRNFDLDKLKNFISDVKADALVVHLNPLQEVIQVDGEPYFRGVYEKIRYIVKNVNLPVIVKEVGAGISKETAAKLELAGVSAINVAGLGGTNWAIVESIRSRKLGDHSKGALGKLFSIWGIPSVVSLIECAQNVKIPLISSGGVRSGLDIAKSLVLGAKYGAMALPVLKSVKKSKLDLSSFVDQLLFEFKTAMFLTGCRSVTELKTVRYFIDSYLRSWLER